MRLHHLLMKSLWRGIDHSFSWSIFLAGVVWITVQVSKPYSGITVIPQFASQLFTAAGGITVRGPKMTQHRLRAGARFVTLTLHLSILHLMSRPRFECGQYMVNDPMTGDLQTKKFCEQQTVSRADMLACSNNATQISCKQTTT